jgi:hypothetical protein
MRGAKRRFRRIGATVPDRIRWCRWRHSAGPTAGLLRASELGVSAMRTCVFAGHAGPSGAEVRWRDEGGFPRGASAAPTADPILIRDRQRSAVLSSIFPGCMAP